MKKRFNIRVIGQDFSVLSNRGDEYVEDVVKYVNDKADEIESNSKDLSTVGIATLVALNIADELFEQKEERKNFYNVVESRSEKLINYIEEKS